METLKLVLVTNLRDWQLIGERKGRRVAALVLLQAPLDANYRAVSAKTWDASAGL